METIKTKGKESTKVADSLKEKAIKEIKAALSLASRGIFLF
jgi:nicotinamide mononucleotide (NMN) deamidase PncC